MGIKVYKILTNMAAGLATVSVVREAHNIGKNYANANLVRGCGNDLVSDTIDAYKINYPSEKYSKIKQRQEKTYRA